MPNNTMNSSEEDWPEPDPGYGPWARVLKMHAGVLLLFVGLFGMILLANGGAITYTDQVSTEGNLFDDASVAGTFITGDLTVTLSEPISESDDIVAFYLVGPNGEQQARVDAKTGQTSVSFTWVTGMRNPAGYTVTAVNSDGEVVSQLHYKRQPVHVWEAWKLL